MQPALHAQLVFVGRNDAERAREAVSRGRERSRSTERLRLVTEDHPRKMFEQGLPESQSAQTRRSKKIALGLRVGVVFPTFPLSYIHVS